MNTVPTLSELLEQSEYHDTLKYDYSGNEWKFSIDDDLRIVPEHKMAEEAITPMPITDHALNQLVTKVGTVTPMVARALRDNPGTKVHLARALEELRYQQQKRDRTRDWLVRGYNGNARAILTTQYANTPNTDLLRLIVKAVEQQAYESGNTVDIMNFPVDRSTVNENDIYMYVGINSVNVPEAGGYKIGFSVRNSEVGSSALYVRPYIQRHSCLNSIVFDAEEFYSVHRGSGRILLTNFVTAVGNAIKISFEGLESLMASREIPVQDIQKEIELLSLKYKWSTDFVASVGVGTEGHESVFGLVSGITYAAHRHFSNNPEAMMETEMIGGKVLVERTRDAVL